MCLLLQDIINTHLSTTKYMTDNNLIGQGLGHNGEETLTLSHDDCDDIKLVAVDVDEVMMRRCDHWRYVTRCGSLK